jgi:hypothetical protein
MFRYENSISVAQNKTAREHPAPLRSVKRSKFDQPLRISGGA